MKNVYILALMAFGSFSLADVFVKGAGNQLGVFETAFVVNVFASVTLMLTRHPDERWVDFWRTNNLWAVNVRAAVRKSATVAAA